MCTTFLCCVFIDRNVVHYLIRSFNNKAVYWCQFIKKVYKRLVSLVTMNLNHLVTNLLIHPICNGWCTRDCISIIYTISYDIVLEWTFDIKDQTGNCVITLYSSQVHNVCPRLSFFSMINRPIMCRLAPLAEKHSVSWNHCQFQTIKYAFKSTLHFAAYRSKVIIPLTSNCMHYYWMTHRRIHLLITGIIMI